MTIYKLSGLIFKRPKVRIDNMLSSHWDSSSDSVYINSIKNDREFIKDRMSYDLVYKKLYILYRDMTNTFRSIKTEICK